MTCLACDHRVIIILHLSGRMVPGCFSLVVLLLRYDHDSSSPVFRSLPCEQCTMLSLSCVLVYLWSYVLITVRIRIWLLLSVDGITTTSGGRKRVRRGRMLTAIISRRVRYIAINPTVLRSTMRYCDSVPGHCSVRH
ncbi:uncharacterized protein BDZ99DRAFT_42715 [Mytilinidion resinicola]|uniref:Uncharacterized protein n=1 Tax=Mytilinidion resinicola TaxID=574789 RepID=A0A6A6YJG3_9PEZI|nr:uncharacterized protein BDZ99DRAFT_42715 [Mytilinidion resinicola]KAF2808941.1 hypothetical protein BDZ99DRAFT_42715 [Mytilinidion resinicola]